MAKIKESLAFRKRHPINLIISNTQRTIPISTKSVQDTLRFLLKRGGILCKEMAIHFVGRKKIASLHKQLFKDPSVTDCITLPYDTTPPIHHFGEIFICPQVAEDYVKKRGGELYREITLYLVHGFLHLLGYNDLTDKQTTEMRKQEAEWMTALAKHRLGITA